MEQIRSEFEVHGPMPDNDWQLFASKLKKVELKAKKPLLNVGKIENYLSFIESGTVRLYIPQDENDLTFGFVFEGGFVSAYDSFLTRTPSLYAIESITTTVLWRISYDNLQTIYQETSVGNLIGRKASENLFLIKSRRELSFLTQSAEERYLSLFSERPELIRQIPLKYIASYIGVTPQALSRIRKRIS
ncbi:Crp/Fnr family transcriptional regulator [Fulvivirga ligni]|uniref:Crp/Fnr family transcriptional regulator n=1 Tax=Fulvivirga ligni TaxID=2904246 RepID=UPI001F1A331C|nr:Crp/Fnr family transcriptional regulator [Fulvivirga ligni]UII20909.1 Crp/Fnr family transcriptional regulator [Fulvivirga ligni]